MRSILSLVIDRKIAVVRGSSGAHQNNVLPPNQKRVWFVMVVMRKCFSRSGNKWCSRVQPHWQQQRL